MILIVCPNLAIDQTILVDHLEIGQVHRPRLTRREAGSKGVNVARVLGTLGVPCVVTGFLGGATGDFVAQSLVQEGIVCAPCSIQNDSRSCYILVESQTSRHTVINEPGPEVSVQEIERFFALFEHLSDKSELVLFSGSLPLGVPDDTYARLVSQAKAAGKRTLLDSSGTALRCAVEARPFLLKINHAEATALRGYPIHDLAGAAAAAADLCFETTSLVMITLGADGAVLVSQQEQYLLVAPKIQVKNSVGSGDAAFAGLAAGLAKGLSLKDLGLLAVASGAANALYGGGHCSMEDITRLQAQVSVTGVDRKR
jgi:tagatose 6-phosphate kinase